MMEPSNFIGGKDMPARVFNSGRGKPGKGQKTQLKTPAIQENNQEEITREMESVLTQSTNFSSLDRTQFYAGFERQSLQGTCVQRVRDLQEENDHLQREISEKEKELTNCKDPLAILADIEHRKIIIARNTGEILKIYLKNEERIKRIKDLEENNSRIQNEMTEMQGRFISTKNMDEKTKFASEFFVLKAQIERNLEEIEQLQKR